MCVSLSGLTNMCILYSVLSVLRAQFVVTRLCHGVTQSPQPLPLTMRAIVKRLVVHKQLETAMPQELAVRVNAWVMEHVERQVNIRTVIAV